MITENKDRSIYCDYCKHDYRKKDGTFSDKVRPAVICVNYKMYKGRVQRRYLCAVCLRNVTELPEGYWAFKDQLEWAREKWEGLLDVQP